MPDLHDWIGRLLIVLILAIGALGIAAEWLDYREQQAGAENVTDSGEAPPIEFYQPDEDATLWRCVCLPPPEEPIALGGVDTGIYGYGTEGAEEMNRIGLVAGGHEFVRCVPLEETR
jgi:hypothetical protein